MNKPFLLFRRGPSCAYVSLGHQYLRCASQQLKSSSSESYYDILGIVDTATEGEIKTAFYEKSKIHHPDSQDSKDHTEFLLLCDAYETLRKKDSRREYDCFLKARHNANRGFHHQTGHPVYSNDFVKWRARHPTFDESREWKYAHEEQKEKLDVGSLLYFAIFCGIIAYIVVSERVRRGKLVSYNANNFAMYEYRQHALRNRKQSTATIPADDTLADNKPDNPTGSKPQRSDTCLDDLKTWK